MKTTNFATIKPKNKDDNLKPITINYSVNNIPKVTRFFQKLVRSALNEKPPRVYKQIIYFCENGKEKYIKPFNI